MEMDGGKSGETGAMKSFGENWSGIKWIRWIGIGWMKWNIENELNKSNRRFYDGFNEKQSNWR